MIPKDRNCIRCHSYRT